MPGQGRKIAYAQRLRAFELYAGGLNLKQVAFEIGVTRQCTANWRKIDKWDDKLRRANTAVEFVSENKAAEILDAFRNKLRKRMYELEVLCGSEDPRTKLAAIKTWFMLTDLLEKRGTGGHSGGELALDDDLKEDVTSVGVPQQTSDSGCIEPSELSNPDLPGAYGPEPDKRTTSPPGRYEHSANALAERLPADSAEPRGAEPGRSSGLP